MINRSEISLRRLTSQQNLLQKQFLLVTGNTVFARHPEAKPKDLDSSAPHGLQNGNMKKRLLPRMSINSVFRQDVFGSRGSNGKIV